MRSTVDVGVAAYMQRMPQGVNPLYRLWQAAERWAEQPGNGGHYQHLWRRARARVPGNIDDPLPTDQVDVCPSKSSEWCGTQITSVRHAWHE
jgi:hypothetical protein